MPWKCTLTLLQRKRVKSKISWQNVHHSWAHTHMFLLSFNITFFFCALFHQVKKMKISAYRTSLSSPPKTRETMHYWFLMKLYCDIFNGVDAILSGRQWNFLTSLGSLECCFLIGFTREVGMWLKFPEWVCAIISGWSSMGGAHRAQRCALWFY